MLISKGLHMMRRSRAYFTVALLLSGFRAAPAQVLDGSRTPDVFSDREALGVLFTVIRSAQPGGWDYATRHKYLMELGLSRPEANRLIWAADAWFSRIHPLDQELREIRKRASGQALPSHARQQADEIAARKMALLDEALGELRLRLGLEGAGRLDQALRQVKRGMKAYVAGTPPQTIEKAPPAHHQHE